MSKKPSFKIEYDEDHKSLVTRDEEGNFQLLTVGQAIRLAIQLATAAGSKALITALGNTIDTLATVIADVVERAIRGALKIKDAINRAAIRQAAEDFELGIKDALHKVGSLRIVMMQAAANRFIKRMKEFGVDGITVEDLLADYR